MWMLEANELIRIPRIRKAVEDLKTEQRVGVIDFPWKGEVRRSLNFLQNEWSTR